MYIVKCWLVIMHALVTHSSNAFSNVNVTSDHVLNTTVTTLSSVSVAMTTDQQLLGTTVVTSIDTSYPTTKENIRNITGYVIENDDADTSLSELQTLFITCTFTLLCLVGVVILGFSLRICWRKLKKQRHSEVYDGVLNKDCSSAPLKGNLTLSADELKSAESQLSVAGTGDTEGVDLDGGSSPVLTYSGASNRTNHASANGSIITMTLKNNHLIVETEERNDIMENSRETTMKYSPSSHDGVFVVEVQQGVRRAPNYSTTAASYNSPEEMLRPSGVNHQRALVHYPPAKILTNTDEDVTSTDTTNLMLVCGGATTGLSQSDLSESSNNFYRYGNQEGYNSGYYGYTNYKGYAIDSTTSTSIETQFQSNRSDEIMTITTNICKNLSSNANQSTNDSVNRRQSVFEPYLLSDVQEKERFSIQKETDTYNENANKLTNLLESSQVKPTVTTATTITTDTTPYTDLTNNISNNYSDDMKNTRQVVSVNIASTTGCSLNDDKLIIEGYHPEQIDTIKS